MSRMRQEKTEVGQKFNECSKIFTKALIRIITSDAPEAKKLEYLTKLYEKI